MKSVPFPKRGYVSQAIAAMFLAVSAVRIGQLINAGVLPVAELGGRRLVEAQAVWRRKHARIKSGRPKTLNKAEVLKRLRCGKKGMLDRSRSGSRREVGKRGKPANQYRP
jgi:hypothetical protein